MLYTLNTSVARNFPVTQAQCVMRKDNSTEKAI